MKKNILFICTDQHRQDSLRFHNPKSICVTPNLDFLAESSMIFDNCYASCPVCTPARSSMQCGLYPSKTGMETNSYQSGCATHEIQDTPFLLSHRLIEAGYQAGYTGKWHLGVGKNKTEVAEGRSLLNIMKKGFMEVGAYENYGTMPTDVGYIGDDFPGHGNGGWKYPQFLNYLKDNNLELKIINQTQGKRPGDHSTVGEVISPIESTIEYFLIERSKALIDQMLEEDKPFYLQLNFWGPHEPFFAPAHYLDMYRNMEIPEWDSFRENTDDMPRSYDLIRRPEQGWEFFQDTLRHYYACITHIDAQLGRLFDYMKEKGIYDNTTIIFSADHGDNQGCHGGLENKSYSMYDDTTKIPLLIHPAGGITHKHCDKLVGTCDLYATILKEAGYEPDNEYGYGDGRPLQPLLNNPDSEWPDEIVTEGMGAHSVIVTQRMYRKGNLKYVFNGVDKDQLFDLEKDPKEMNNLAYKKEYADTLYQIRNEFADWMKIHNDSIWSAFCKINHIKLWE